jgi:hypothetical protein
MRHMVIAIFDNDLKNFKRPLKKFHGERTRALKISQLVID